MRVGIVGAGITGLALTHYLTERDIDCVTFEASPAPGGVISSQRVEGYVIERGPQRMRKTPGLVELAHAGGVADEMCVGGEGDLYVYANGRLGKAPLTARELLETDLLSWRGKLRLLAEPLTRAGDPEETVADVFIRKFGREAYERFVGPLYGGLYGSDPARMPAAFALEGLLEREQETRSLLRAFRQRVAAGQSAPPVAFEGGNQQLATGVATTYTDKLHLETPVTGIHSLGEESPSSEGITTSATGGTNPDLPTDDSGYLLEHASGSTAVDHVVVTTPAAVTAELLAGIVPEVTSLADLTYNPLALVAMEADVDQEGKGYQVGYGESLRTLGAAWNPNLFGDERLHTAFLGGMFDPELVNASDARLAEIATAEFETVTGSQADVVAVNRLDPGFPAWDESWWALEDLTLPAGITLATNYTDRMGIPSRIRQARTLAETLDGGPSSESPSPNRDP